MTADLMILDLNEPAFVPFNSAARQIVFSEAGRAVETVLVGGRPVVRDGKLVTVDEAALAAEVEEIAPAFRRDARSAGRGAAPISSRRCLNANREAWKVRSGFERYIGRGTRAHERRLRHASCFLLSQPTAINVNREDRTMFTRMLSRSLATCTRRPSLLPSPRRPKTGRRGRVTMVVPFAAGSASDTVGPHPRRRSCPRPLGQQVIIENVGGARRHDRHRARRESAPDGYQFVFAQRRHHGHRSDAATRSRSTTARPISPPAGLVVEQPIVLITRNDLPVNTLQEFVAYAKANHGKMQFGSSGVGSGSHFSCAQLERGDRHRADACSLSRLRAGHAGPGRRPHRLSSARSAQPPWPRSRPTPPRRWPF